MDFDFHHKNIVSNGYAVIEDVFSFAELTAITEVIAKADTNKSTFRKTEDLFAIRQVLKEVPDIVPLVFSKKLKTVIDTLVGSNYFPVKSIYFDKPAQSNWFVAYHQDLTISVKERREVPGCVPWTVKQNHYAVQPPLPILENNFTIRIHLDDADENNGALKVIPGSHLKGVYRPENIDWSAEKEDICKVKAGGIMMMKPLLLHASNRTVNDKKRRVLHIEFSNQQLDGGLEWSERVKTP